MKKLIIVLLFAIIPALFLIDCGDGTSISPSTSLAITVEGTGDAVTEAFLLNGEEGKFNFEVKWSSTGKQFNFFVSPSSVNNPSIAGNYDDALVGSMPVHFNHTNPFATKGEFAIEVIATQDCNWIIEIWQ